MAALPLSQRFYFEYNYGAMSLAIKRARIHKSNMPTRPGNIELEPRVALVGVAIDVVDITVAVNTLAPEHETV